MQENLAHVDSLKTCCGVLAILSRDEANKLLIARDGIRLLTSVMNTHISNSGLQEAACDLIWSLAFNNNLVKEVIGRQGGIPVIIKGMRIHASSADLLKSSCGALSNMCQNTHNQSLIAAHGGISCILEALRRHKSNAILLPFIFDALASLIVGNERNAREVSETGAISLILESINEHGGKGELVKSGCHALAILSDSQGQGTKISAADGVKVLLPTLRAHPNHLDLHRVAAVVLLRMLQESPVAREIAERGGVPLMLCVLKEQQHEVETIAAACHILYSITHPDAVGNAKHPVDIESQLIMPPVYDSEGNVIVQDKEKDKSKGAGRSRSTINNLSAIITVIQKHGARKDIVRACVRSMVNLSRFRALLAWIDASESVGQVLAAASIHTQARDITDSCATLLKSLGRRVRGRPGARLSLVRGKAAVAKAIAGVLSCLKARPNDMELVAAVFATLRNTLQALDNLKGKGEGLKDEGDEGNWEKDAGRVTLVWASMLVRELPTGKIRDEEGTDLLVGSKITNSSSSPSTFWTPDRASSVLQMALFLQNLIKSKISQSKGVVLFPLPGSPGSKKPVLDIVSAKDVCSSLFESLPQPDPSSKRSAPPSDDVGQDTGESKTGQNSHLIDVYSELEKVLNLLVPATQEAEMSEAAEQAAKNVAVKVTQPPPPIVTQVEGKSIADHLGKEGGEAAMTAKSHSEIKNTKGSRLAREASTGSLRKSGSPRKGRSPKRKPGKSAANFLQFKYKCTCSHGTGYKTKDTNLAGRDLPVHPLNDPACDVKHLHQHSPNELEMIHAGRSFSINEAEYGGGGQVPEKALLCYKGGTAAGLGVGSRETMRFPYTIPESYVPEPYAHSLSFDACFESGNLYTSIQVGPAEYDLMVRPDLHSAVGHNQWFYFAVSNTHTKQMRRNKDEDPEANCPSRVKFNIVNMLKNDSLFNYGMRPVVYSSQDSRDLSNVGWTRCGVPGTIGYYQNRWTRVDPATGADTDNKYYTLSFTVDFHNPGDTYLLAHSYPYTYSDYKLHLSSLLGSARTSRHMRRKLLCKR